MKNTKKLLTWILVAVLIVSTVVLVACVDKPSPTQLTDLKLPDLKDNQMAVIIKNGDNDYTSYTVTLGAGGTNATTAEQVLEYLVETAQLHLDCEGEGSAKFINSIGKVTPDSGKGEYIEIFTSNSAFYGDWAGVSEIKVDDVTLKSAAKGIYELAVVAGDVLYFQISVFSW